MSACPRCSIGTPIFGDSCIVCCTVNDSIASLLKELVEKKGATEAKNRDLVKALGDLAVKLHAIDTDDSLKAIFGLAAAHGWNYTGPNWKDDLIAADAALKANQ